MNQEKEPSEKVTHKESDSSPKQAPWPANLDVEKEIIGPDGEKITVSFQEYLKFHNINNRGGT